MDDDVRMRQKSFEELFCHSDCIIGSNSIIFKELDHRSGNHGTERMPLYALAIFLGTLFAFYQNQLPDLYWLSYLPLLLLLGWYLPTYRYAILLAASYLWASGAFHFHLEHRLSDAYNNRDSLLRGIVVDIPHTGSGRVRFDLRIEHIDGYSAGQPRLLRLSWYQTAVIPRSGERWQFEARLRRPGGYLNPDGFDFEAWQFGKGIDGGGYVRRSPHNRRLAEASPANIHGWRAVLAESIGQNCSGCAHSGLIKALALGHRGDIPSAHKRVLQASGTAHLLAISGLHVGLVAWMAFALGRGCWRLGLHRSGLARAQLGSLFSLTAALSYAALAGFSLPTVRALIMLTVLLLALICRQRVNLLQSFSLAVIIILLADPRAAGSASFWLSAGALLVIGFAQFNRIAGLSRWRQLIALQFYFSLLFLPLGILVFGQVNPAGFGANLVAIPVIGFAVLPLVLAACLLTGAGISSAWLLGIVDRLLGGLLGYLEWLLDGGLQSVFSTAIPGWVLLATTLATCLLLAPLSTGLRRAGLILIVVCISWQPERLGFGEYRLDVLDVGMGTSAVLRTREHSLIYDFGPGKPGFSSADWTLVPFLRQRGIAAADLLIVSHVDQDHSGGFQSFVQDLQPARLLSGTPAELAERYALAYPVRSCHDYPEWTWDGVRLRFFSLAPTGLSRDTNNRSCVLLVEGRHRALLPGDIEAARETQLLRDHGRGLAADILLAPHHGSETSSQLSFLRAVEPAVVIFTVSRNNRWRFPHAGVSARYASLGSRQYRSDRHGAVTLTSTASGLAVTTMRQPPRRIWRRW